MATWKKLLTDGDNTNLANTNLTASSSRTYTLGAVSSLKFVSDNGTELIKLTSGPVGANFDAIDMTAPEINLRHSVGTASPTLKLFESGNDAGDHYIGLKSPSSISGSYTLTLPTADGDSGEVLVTDGSGNLSFSAVSGGGSVTIDNYAENRVLTAGNSNGNIDAESFLLYSPYSVAQQNNGSTNLLSNTGVYLSKSNGSKPTGFLMDTDNSYGDGSLDAGSTSSTPYSNSGVNLSIQFTSSNLTQGRLHMLNSSGALVLPQANSGNTSSGMVGLYISGDLSSQTSATLLMQGMALLPNTCFEGTFNESAILYLSDTTAGKLTYTIPDTAGDIVRHMGYAVRQVTASSTASTLIYFNPSMDFLEIA